MIVRVLLVTVLLSTAGCTTLQTLREPAQFIATENPRVVHVTYKNRTIEVVAQPRVSGDSLFGALQRSPSHRVAVPLSQVELIQAIQPNGKRTTMMIAGLAVFTATTVLVLSNSGSGPSCDRTARPSYLPNECRQ